MSDNDRHFVDSNILVYAALADDPRHSVSRALLGDSSRGELAVSLQILSEFYSIITNARRVSEPYTPADAIVFIETLISYGHVIVLPASVEVADIWLALVKSKGLKGPRVFDLQIVATMIAHRVRVLFTYNGSDFAFPELEVLEPR